MNEPPFSDRYFWFALVASAAILLVEILLPLGFDNNIYQSMGLAMVRGDGLPYIASWDNNFPGIAYIHALSILLFGNSDLGFRLLDLILQTIGAGLFYLLLIRWLPRRTALIAVLIRAIYYVGGQWGLLGQRDGYAVICIMGALLLFYRSEESSRSTRGTAALFTAGLLMGLLVAFRPTYALYPLLFAAMLLRSGDRWRRVSWFAGGVAGLWCIILVPYLLIPGGLAQVYYSIIRFNIDLYSHIDVPRALFNRGRGALLVFALVGLWTSWRKIIPIRSTRTSDIRRDAMLLGGCLASGTISMVLMGKYFDYHWEPTAMYIIAFASIGAAWLIERISARSIQTLLSIVAVVSFGYFQYPRQLIRMFAEEVGKSAQPIHAVHERVLDDPRTGLAVQESVVHYLNDHCSPNDIIECCAVDPNIRWRSDRKQATRFGSMLPVTIRTVDGKYPPYEVEWRADWIHRVNERRPRYLVLPNGPDDWFVFAADYPHNLPHQIAGFDSLLAARYTLDTVVGGFTLYRIQQ